MDKITHVRRKPSSRRGQPQSRLRRATFEALEQRTLLSISVTQYRYDYFSSGLNPNETILTPANVSAANSFGKLYTTAVDGQVLAQPLYVANLDITTGSFQGVHNVVFVATEHDGLYAIDATDGQILWSDSLIINTSGAPSGSVTITTVPNGDVNSGDISPEIGITGTPAIDPNTGFLYVVGTTKDVYANDTADPHSVLTLYKVNIANGSYTFSVIADTTYASNGNYYYFPAQSGNDANAQYNTGPYVIGSGAGFINVGGQNRVYFNALRQMFRPAVEVVNGQVVLGSASHGDNGPYHGWMLTFNESTLALTGVLNATPNGSDGGIWAAGDPITTDGLGDFYFMTGNGSFNTNSSDFPNPSTLSTTTGDPGLPIDGDYGQSFVKVQLDPTTTQSDQNANGWGLKVVELFHAVRRGVDLRWRQRSGVGRTDSPSRFGGQHGAPELARRRR